MLSMSRSRATGIISLVLGHVFDVDSSSESSTRRAIMTHLYVACRGFVKKCSRVAVLKIMCHSCQSLIVRDALPGPLETSPFPLGMFLVALVVASLPRAPYVPLPI